jgi:glycosidase
LQYFKQWAIWWIEYANLDGLRVDTYPYIEMVPGSEWVKAIMDEYPNFNIVGECWTRPTPAVAYWQAGVKNHNGFDSHMPSVMDFPLEEAIRQALESDNQGWGGGLTRVYDVLTMDYMYADVNDILIMLGNHDMDRIADVVKDGDLRRVKLATTLLATMRGIPQVFYGDEYGMKSSDRSLGHSTLRMPLPLNGEVTSEMQYMFDYQSRLFQWRKGEPVIHTGRTMHFMSRDNTYGFFRYNDNEAVFVFVNASEDNRTIPTANYAEILSKYNPVGEDVISGIIYDLSEKDIVIEPLSSIVVKLQK